MPARTKSQSKIAKAVDRQLERYRSMRDFGVTAEPRGAPNGRGSAKESRKLPFVVQKHAARQLHYDFRLGWRGVLKSWAVSKGPSYYPGDKRLAVQVEDHPIEYGGFEGTIPKGQYGGGAVMVWDFGDWSPIGDADRGFEEGNLKFELHGKKLRGKWALIRMKRNLDRSDKPNWLLIKEKDEFAQPQDTPAIVDLAPDSAVTDRTIDEIAESDDHVWDSKKGLREQSPPSVESAATDQKPAAKPKKRTAALEKLLGSAPRESFPGFISPQLAQQADSAPNGDEWVHELKLDGYRIQVQVRSKGTHRTAKLLTRKGLDWTSRMPDIARAAARLDVEDAILDGEVVALDDEGKPSFAELQAAFQEGKQKYLTYFAFDLLHLNGHNLRELTLLERKSLLIDIVSRIGPGSPLHLSEHIKAKGEEVFAHACKLGAEGIVSKVTTANYTSGRSNVWLKIKCVQEQEFVIGGFTPPGKGGHGIGALLLGYYEGSKLRYAGRSGTGFTQKTHQSLRTRLDKLIEKAPPFVEVPREARKDAIWVRPQLVAQISFATWTHDNLVRQAAFKGLREDKSSKEVVREVAIPKIETASSVPRTRKVAGAVRGNGKAAMTLPITHPDKVLDEQSGMTKQDLAEYYLAVAEHILPHIADRPLSLVRCPEGTGKQCFFQKHIGLGLPEGIGSIPVPNKKTGKKEDFVTLNSKEGLLGLAQMGVLEIHPWGSRNESLEKPDRIIFDLDPDIRIEWKTLASAALDLCNRLKKLELTSYLKSTGGKGLHVVIPIEPQNEWQVIKQFAHSVVLGMEKDEPNLYITKMTKAERTNRIYLDYLRNDRESTAIAPFSPRARSGVAVAITLDWKELGEKEKPEFHVSDFESWKTRLRRDPWKTMAKSQQRLTEEAIRAASVRDGNRRT